MAPPSSSDDPGDMDNKPDIRRLTRSRRERIVAGVCGGVAEYFSVDANLIRLLLVISCFFGGAGVLLYAGGWILLPEEGEARSIAQRMVGHTPGQ